MVIYPTMQHIGFLGRAELRGNFRFDRFTVHIDGAVFVYRRFIDAISAAKVLQSTPF